MSGHHPFDKLRAQMTPERRARNAAKTQALLAASPQQALQGARPTPMPSWRSACRALHGRSTSWSTRWICISARYGAVLKPWGARWKSRPISLTGVFPSRTLRRAMPTNNRTYEVRGGITTFHRI